MILGFVQNKQCNYERIRFLENWLDINEKSDSYWRLDEYNRQTIKELAAYYIEHNK